MMSHDHTQDTHSHDGSHSQPALIPKVEVGAHVNVRFLLIFYVAMVVFVLVTVFVLIIFFGYSKTNMASKLVENTHEYSTGFMPYAEEAKGRLNEFAWVDRDAETVRVPWEVAARNVVANYSGPASDAEESNN
jgi:hypothetical protein